MFSYNGTIVNGGCDTGNGSWSSQAGSGSWSWSKACDIPQNELTQGGVWGGIQGLYPLTVYGFNGLLIGPRDYQGRIVTEYDGGDGSDSCHREGDVYDEFVRITGGDWNVGDIGDPMNWYGEDGLGRSEDVVAFYREAGRTPCESSFLQNMTIRCNSGTTNRVYAQNRMRWKVALGFVEVYRGPDADPSQGVTATTFR